VGVFAVEIAQNFGVGFELGREERAEFRQHCGRVSIVGMGGLIVDDPPAIFTLRLGCWPGAKDAVNLNRTQAAGDDSGPANLAGSLCVR
jgi:hypothetical protein